MVYIGVASSGAGVVRKLPSWPFFSTTNQCKAYYTESAQPWEIWKARVEKKTGNCTNKGDKWGISVGVGDVILIEKAVNMCHLCNEEIKDEICACHKGSSVDQNQRSLAKKLDFSAGYAINSYETLEESEQIDWEKYNNEGIFKRNV